MKNKQKINKKIPSVQTREQRNVTAYLLGQLIPAKQSHTKFDVNCDF